MDSQQETGYANSTISGSNTDRNSYELVPDNNYLSLIKKYRTQNEDNVYDVIRKEEATLQNNERAIKRKPTWKLLAILFCTISVILSVVVIYLVTNILYIRRYSCLYNDKYQAEHDTDFSCKCKNGNSGRCCEITPCDRVICESGKSCLYSGNITLCVGDLTQASGLVDCKSICDSSPCGNNGQCIEVVGGYKCVCFSGYTGVLCSNLINPCSRLPCRNNGTCTENGYEYKCTCTKGFSGSDCDETPCYNSPCKNGGLCENTDNGRNCICKNGYSGEDCEITPCSNGPCENGGSCSIWGNVYHCTCPLGTFGLKCENMSCAFPEYRQKVLLQRTCNILPCPKHWMFNIATFSCYWISTYKANWRTAYLTCQRMQPHASSLVYIQSHNEINWLKQFINEDIWVGGRVFNNQYRWQSSEYNYTINNLSDLWARNEPNVFTNEYCVQLWKTAEGLLLDDTPCGYEKHFICKTNQL
ncbi:neurogenic locus Notch protein-like [Mytilus californianus]|uniref:neurogenic locus Notch protein-like n=1 Tax=Mytilus californianus TaxID=6549 RepID=UPI002247E58F|nr:neurogenic locus Notch protein-like [Mytilus californianus]